METEQTSQALAASARGRTFVPPPSIDPDEIENSPGRGLNLRALGRTIQRQALLIAGVATLVAVGASYVAMREPPAYEGDFQLLVEPVTDAARVSDPSTVTRTDPGPAGGGDRGGLDYTTQIQILQSPGMLNRIVQDVQTQYPDFTYEELRQGLTVERLAVENSPDPTRLLQVTYEGSDPGRVQKVLRVTADRYLEYSLEDRKTRYGQGISFIEDQLPAVEQRVDQIQDELQQLQQQNRLIDPDTQGGQLSEQTGEIAALELETNRALQEQRRLFSNLQQQLNLSPEQAVAASALSEDPNYQALQTQLVDIQSQIALESSRFGSNSPVLRSLEAKRDNLEALIAQRAEEVVGSGNTGNPQVQAYQNSVRLDLIGQLIEARNQIQVLEVRQQEIEQAQQQFSQQLQQFPEVARRYSELIRELEISTQTLDRLRTQLETLRVEAAQTEVPWELISDPLIPRDAQGDPIPEPSEASRIVIAGAALGLILGTLLALLVERYRNVFYTVDDVQEAIPLPLVGVVPFSRGAKQSFDFPSTFSTEDIDDSRLGTASFREAFSDLYSNIRLSYPPIRSLMICSAEPGDGKTTIALYLAQTAAGAGQKVLLVDTNLRLPQIHSRLDLPNTKGLSGLLANDLKPEEFIQRSSLSDTLHVLTAGPSIPGSARLLGSDRMQRLIEKLRSEYDLVIYDTPHLYGLTDASFLTAQMDEILMVVAAGKTNRTIVDQVLSKLTAVRPTGVSLVTNYLKESSSSAPYTRQNQNGVQSRQLRLDK
ncbi:MAG: polysaccharide biosynthesis tyrosine autokinase [Elainellaceae cyanobacterium]